MAEGDLLILQLLKFPVAIIRLLSNSMAILTYLPNYLVILGLDSILFSARLTSSATAYVLSWPLRLASLATILYLFYFELISLYQLLSISQLHWGWQVFLMLVSSQIIVALMRHGYLSMISKFDPVKLKSPLEHILEIFSFLIDILCLFLCLINILLILKANQTFAFQYREPPIQSRIARKRPEIHNKQKAQRNLAIREKKILKDYYPFLHHLLKMIHSSILAYVHLFYIKIFFRAFPWRYQASLTEVNSESGNILNLSVLLTLLFLATILDILVLAVLGIYCYYLHPRKWIYRKWMEKQHRKYRPTLSFLMHSISEVMQILILLPCFLLKWKLSKQILLKILNPNNDYGTHHWTQIFYVIKLCVVKLPSLFCLVFVALSGYKLRKMNVLKAEREKKWKAMEEPSEERDSGAQASAKASKSKGEEKRYSRENRMFQDEYIIFRCFGELLAEIVVWPFVVPATLAKPWNIFWLKYVLDQDYNLRSSLVLSYNTKNIKDYLCFLPALFFTLIHLIYDPTKVWAHLKRAKESRSIKMVKLAHNNTLTQFQFFDSESASTGMVLSASMSQIMKDIFFIPLFLCARLSLVSVMGCEHPENSVELFEHLWIQFYIRRVRKSPHFEEYVEFYKKDEAAGLIKTQKDRLRFWKFAHKSLRQRTFAWVLSHLMPSRRAEKAIANTPIVRGYSSISNHYWHRYNTTKALSQYFFFFLIELAVTVIGFVILLPLTLWRLPTFFLLFKVEKYKKSKFFPILKQCYLQMFKDLKRLIGHVLCIILFPRATCTFMYATAFRYHPEGLSKFSYIQEKKHQYVSERIVQGNITFYIRMVQVGIIKGLWMRKRAFNQEMEDNNLKLREMLYNFIFQKCEHPSFKDLCGQEDFKIPKQTTILDNIINKYFDAAMEDIPYIMLSFFLIFTLPWRFHYIKNAVLLLREHRRNRIEFHVLVKKLLNDYLCILLYLFLFLSLVKTKRVLILIKRNIKLNFYVGFLKYSHLEELKRESIEAIKSYQSLFVLALAFIYGPYRAATIFTNTAKFLKKIREERKEKEKLARIHERTVKEGKELQLLTNIGYQSLIHICQFLTAKELTQMTGVSKYLYEGIRESEQIWAFLWQQVYVNKFPTIMVKNARNEINYNEMCVRAEKMIWQKVGKVDNSFYAFAANELMVSVIHEQFDLKLTIKQLSPNQAFPKVFRQVLHHTEADGYGPEETWPQPGDNEEYLALFNIQRRQVRPELTENQAYENWLLFAPVEFLIVRMARFYNNNSKRRLKQLLYALTYLCPFLLFWLAMRLWSWFWEIDSLIGIKLISLVYTVCFLTFFVNRYQSEARNWISIHPFDLIEDVKDVFRTVKFAIRDGLRYLDIKLRVAVNYITNKLAIAANYISNKLTVAGRWVKVQIIDRLMVPLKWVGRKIKQLCLVIRDMIVRVVKMFIEKVAVPLYQSIAHKLKALWILITKLLYKTLEGLKSLYSALVGLLKQGFRVLITIAKNISQSYARILENSLDLSLQFGIVGELIFTLIVLLIMVSPSLCCYYLLWGERWAIIMSTLLTMVLIVTGYRHLSKHKEERNRKSKSKSKIARA